MGGRVPGKTKINLMNLAPRCKSSAVTGFRVCRMHGARGGAPEGKRNGNYRHGGSTKKALVAMAEIRLLTRICRETLDAV